MTFQELKKIIAADQYRYEAGRGFKDFVKQWLRESGFRFTVIMRFCAFLRSQRITRYGTYHVCLWIHRRMQVRYGVYIEFSTQIGAGLYIGHTNSIVVNTRSKIGENCSLSHSVTLGQTHGRSKHPGVPVIGDRVYLGCGAKILGGIHVGNDVVVAPNAVVTKDVPQSAVIGGIPAKILSLEGSQGYVSNTWSPDF
ncbi:MAG: serine acetyltransferase [Verrucomicrobia bacterium]|nr:serine acetyltransferase [Verrucomicrobiota bacterium]